MLFESYESGKKQTKNKLNRMLKRNPLKLGNIDGIGSVGINNVNDSNNDIVS